MYVLSNTFSSQFAYDLSVNFYSKFHSPGKLFLGMVEVDFSKVTPLNKPLHLLISTWRICSIFLVQDSKIIGITLHRTRDLTLHRTRDLTLHRTRDLNLHRMRDLTLHRTRDLNLHRTRDLTLHRTRDLKQNFFFSKFEKETLEMNISRMAWSIEAKTFGRILG